MFGQAFKKEEALFGDFAGMTIHRIVADHVDALCSGIRRLYSHKKFQGGVCVDGRGIDDNRLLAAMRAA